MSIKSNITDSATKMTAQVVKKEACNCQALAVATVPYRDFENDLRFFSSAESGINMNVNVAFSGTPDKIHDGTDSVLWTATDIVGGGKTTFNSADQNHTPAGELSIKVDNAPVDDVYQIAKGSDVTMSNYVALTMWVYVDKNWKALDAVEMYCWDNGTNTQIGTAVDLSDYFEFLNYGIWQRIVIPLTDFGEASGSTIVDAFRVIQLSGEGKAPKYYLDDIQLEEAGTPVKFSIKADKGTWLYVDEFTISMADNISGTLADATMPYLAYDKFLGVSLVSGLNYQRVEDGNIVFSATILSMMDFLQLPGTEVSAYGSDGTNTWVTLKAKHIEPLLLKSEDEDELIFTVSDDLSGLLHLRISAGCRLERR